MVEYISMESGSHYSVRRQDVPALGKRQGILEEDFQPYGECYSAVVGRNDDLVALCCFKSD